MGVPSTISIIVMPYLEPVRSPLRATTARSDFIRRLARGQQKAAGTFTVDDKVKAKFVDQATWYKATIEANNGDGTYKIKYDCGYVEDHQPVERIRPRSKYAKCPA